MKKLLIIIGIVFVIILPTVSQTENSENTSEGKSEHCFSEEEYKGILDLYYETQELSDKVCELKRILGIKDSALTICVNDYTYMQESLVLIKDSLSTYSANISIIRRDFKDLGQRYQRTKLIAICTSTGLVVVVVYFIINSIVN